MCWVSLPRHSPGVWEARDVESPAPQTPQKKEPADQGEILGMEGSQKPGHELETPPQLPWPEATKLLLIGPPGQLFLCRTGLLGATLRLHGSSLLPLCVWAWVGEGCAQGNAVGPLPPKDGMSQGDPGRLGLASSGTLHICMTCSASLPQPDVLRIFWHKVCLE